MAVKLLRKKPHRQIEYLTPTQINESLWNHGWVNNTLSPVTQQPYWDMMKNIVPSDEDPMSAVFAYSHAGSFLHNSYVFLATDKWVYAILENAGYIVTKKLAYEDFVEIDLFSDYWLKSLTYVDMYLSRFRFYKIETSDPTSTIHFKNVVLGMQKKLGVKKSMKEITSFSSAKKFGMSLWRFFWRKFRFLLNIKWDKKSREAAKQSKAMETKTKIGDQSSFNE